MKAAVAASIIAVCCASAAHSQQPAVECGLKLQGDGDLRSLLFSRAAQSLTSNVNIASDVAVTAELSDDQLFDGQGMTQPVSSLLRHIRPTSFRLKRAPGILRRVGDPCGEHDLSFKATTADAREVWPIDVRFEAGIIQRVHAARSYYEQFQPMEPVNG